MGLFGKLFSKKEKIDKEDLEKESHLNEDEFNKLLNDIEQNVNPDSDDSSYAGYPYPANDSKYHIT